MQRGNLDDLLPFLAVARKRSLPEGGSEARRVAVGATGADVESVAKHGPASSKAIRTNDE
jgi:hypothetical protein